MSIDDKILEVLQNSYTRALTRPYLFALRLSKFIVNKQGKKMNSNIELGRTIKVLKLTMASGRSFVTSDINPDKMVAHFKKWIETHPEDAKEEIGFPLLEFLEMTENDYQHNYLASIESGEFFKLISKAEKGE